MSKEILGGVELSYSIGVKLVQHGVMSLDTYNKEFNKNVVSDEIEGYVVKYSDGYVSWSPKSTFEKSNIILGKKPKITNETLDSFIGATDSFKLGDKTTVVAAKTKSGFEIVETSSCVNPDDYDHELGVKYATKKIYNRLWENFGFLLQVAKFGVDNVCEIKDPEIIPEVNESTINAVIFNDDTMRINFTGETLSKEYPKTLEQYDIDVKMIDIAVRSFVSENSKSIIPCIVNGTRTEVEVNECDTCIIEERCVQRDLITFATNEYKPSCDGSCENCHCGDEDPIVCSVCGNDIGECNCTIDDDGPSDEIIEQVSGKSPCEPCDETCNVTECLKHVSNNTPLNEVSNESPEPINSIQKKKIEEREEESIS